MYFDLTDKLEEEYREKKNKKLPEREMAATWSVSFIHLSCIGKISIEFLRFHVLDDNYVFPTEYYKQSQL